MGEETGCSTPTHPYPHTPTRNSTMNTRLRQSILLAATLLLLALSLVPFAMMAVMSLKSNAQIFAHFWELPRPARWGSYMQAYAALISYIVNTLIVATL